MCGMPDVITFVLEIVNDAASNGEVVFDDEYFIFRHAIVPIMGQWPSRLHASEDEIGKSLGIG